MTDTWYYARDGQPVGPVSREQLIAALIRSPNWQQEFVWKPEYATWLEAGAVNELSFEIAQSDLVQHPVQDESQGLREASVRATSVVYLGLASLGIVGAIIYHWLF